MGSALHRLLLLSLLATASALAQSDNPAVLDLHKILGSAYACDVPRHIQFVAENELILLAGPTTRCYEQVSSLELVAISLDGKILARRPWTSTDPGLVLVPQRLARPIPGGIDILDTSLKTVQTLHLRRNSESPSITATDTGILTVTSRGRSTFYAGAPLRPIDPPPAHPHPPGQSQLISTLDGSWELLRQGSTLVESRPGVPPRTFADLSWILPPCAEKSLCQADDTATRYQTVIGRHNRILITATGQRLPIQGAFGLLPYFRAQVIDLDTGREVYREEDEFRARNRIAALSPDGDTLVVSDGYTAVVHPLP